MAHIRVGVRKIRKGFEVPYPVPDGETVADAIDVQQCWVEINGQRFEGDWLDLLAVEYRSEGGVNEVVIRTTSSGFETVDHRTPCPTFTAVSTGAGDLSGMVDA